MKKFEIEELRRTLAVTKTFPGCFEKNISYSLNDYRITMLFKKKFLKINSLYYNESVGKNLFAQ